MEYNRENTLQILSELSAAQFGLFCAALTEADVPKAHSNSDLDGHDFLVIDLL